MPRRLRRGVVAATFVFAFWVVLIFFVVGSDLWLPASDHAELAPRSRRGPSAQKQQRSANDAGQSVHKRQGEHPTMETATSVKKKKGGEAHQVERKQGKAGMEVRDGYRITADSPFIRDRVRELCNCTKPEHDQPHGADDEAGEPRPSGWQQSYMELHRKILNQRRRANKESKRTQKSEWATFPSQKIGAVGEKYLIFSCPLGRTCGGWGDRMYGVLNAFFVALLTDRALLIDWELPFPYDIKHKALTARQASLLKRYSLEKESDNGDEASDSMTLMTNGELEELGPATHIAMMNRILQEVEAWNESRFNGKQAKKPRFSLDRILEPTNIDWRFDRKLITHHIKEKDFVIIDTLDQHESVWQDVPLSEIDIDWDMFEFKTVAIWHSNNWYVNAFMKNLLYQKKVKDLFGVDPSTFSDTHSLHTWTATLYGCFINYLFRPTPPVKTIITAYSELIRRRGFTLGVQLRMGGQSVKWIDPTRNKPEDIPLFFRCARDLLSSHNGSTSSSHPLAAVTPIRGRVVPAEPDEWNVFIMTDSDFVKDALKRDLGSRALTVDLPIGHIDKESPSFESYLTIAVEAWLLGECDFIVSSRSNLGWFAARRTLHDVRATHLGKEDIMGGRRRRRRHSPP